MAGLCQLGDISSGHLGPHCGISESVFTPVTSKGLFKAVHDANFLRVRLLLSAGADINARNELGETVLIAALRIEEPQKRLGLFRWLMRAGVSVTTPDKVTGRDAILWSAYLNRTPELYLALEGGISDCNLTRRDRYGYCALHYSVLHGNVAATGVIADLQRRFGLPLDSPDRHEVSPYLHALRLNHDQCAAILKPRPGDSADEVDSGSVRKRIAQLQEIRLARSLNKEPRIRRSSTLSLPVPCAALAAPRHLPYVDPLHHSNLSHLRNENQTLQIKGSLSGSMMEYRKEPKSCISGNLTDLENVSVNISHLPPEVSPNRACKVKRCFASENILHSAFNGENSLPAFMKSPQKGNKNHEYRSFIPQLFALYAEQQTGSMLPAAQPPVAGNFSFGAVVNATKFAMMLRSKQKERAKCQPLSSASKTRRSTISTPK